MPLIAFKDNGDGFYQTEVADKNETPEWAKNMTRLTDDERLAELEKNQSSQPTENQSVAA